MHPRTPVSTQCDGPDASASSHPSMQYDGPDARAHPRTPVSTQYNGLDAHAPSHPRLDAIQRPGPVPPIWRTAVRNKLYYYYYYYYNTRHHDRAAKPFLQRRFYFRRADGGGDAAEALRGGAARPPALPAARTGAVGVEAGRRQQTRQGEDEQGGGAVQGRGAEAEGERSTVNRRIIWHTVVLLVALLEGSIGVITCTDSV